MIAAADPLDPGVTEVLVYLGVLAFAAVTIKAFPEMWRDEKRRLEPTPERWFWGDVLWRGFVRMGLPSGGLMMVGGALLLPWPFVLPEDSTAQYVSLIVWIAWFGLVLLLGFSTVLFARPKSVIAPPLRHQRGAIAAERGDGRASTGQTPGDPWTQPRALSCGWDRRT